MLAHLVQTSRRQARSWLAAVVPCRHYASQAEGGPEDPFEQGPTYANWLQTEGLKYQVAHRPKNWLGGEVPFPLNPSFKPPTPVSYSTRCHIWEDYMANPSEAKIRSLAQQHGISITRIQAILRLQGLEERWREEVNFFFWFNHDGGNGNGESFKPRFELKDLHPLSDLDYVIQADQLLQNRSLQTGFLSEMQRLLGIDEKKEQSPYSGRNMQGVHELSQSTVEADELSEATKDVARVRYQRLFYEPVVEGQDPILPIALARAVVAGVQSSNAKEVAALKRLRHLKSETEPTSDVVVERPGRPTLRFVDIGVKFVDVKDRLKRVNAAKRRKVLNRRRGALRRTTLIPSEEPATVAA